MGRSIYAQNLVKLQKIGVITSYMNANTNNKNVKNINFDKVPFSKFYKTYDDFVRDR